MKKIVAIVLSFAMMIGMAAICTFAEEGYSADGVVAAPVEGKTTVTVSVTAPAAEKLTGITVAVSFNTDKLTLVEEEKEANYFVGQLIPNQVGMVNISDGKIALQAIALTASEDDVFPGGTADYVKLNFTVAEGATLEEGDVTVAVTDAVNFDIETINEKFGTSVTFAKPDTTALEAAIAKAEALTAEDYTEASFAAVTTALEAAKAALEGTQDEINAAAAALEDAISKLVKVEEPGTEEPGTEEPGTEEPGTEKPGTEEPDEETPPTADASVFAYVSVAVIAMAAVAFVVSKRKKA